DGTEATRYLTAWLYWSICGWIDLTASSIACCGDAFLRIAFSMPTSVAWRAAGITPSRQPWVALSSFVAWSWSIAVRNCGYWATHAWSVGSFSAFLSTGK